VRNPRNSRTYEWNEGSEDTLRQNRLFSSTKRPHDAVWTTELVWGREWSQRRENFRLDGKRKTLRISLSMTLKDHVRERNRRN